MKKIILICSFLSMCLCCYSQDWLSEDELAPYGNPDKQKKRYCVASRDSNPDNVTNLMFLDTMYNKIGLISPDRRIIIPAVWDDIQGTGCDGKYKVLVGRTLWGTQLSWYGDVKIGIVDSVGRVIVPLVYTCMGVFEDSVAVYTKSKFQPNRVDKKSRSARHPYDGKWGLIHANGYEITKPIYDYITILRYRYLGGLYMVRVDRKYGLVDKNGKEVIPIVYKRAVDAYEEAEKLFEVVAP